MKQFILAVLTLIMACNVLATSVSAAGKLRQNNLRSMQPNGADSKAVEDLLRLTKFDSTTADPNYFQKFRIELNRLSQEEHTLSKSRGVIKHSVIKLPIDTAGFFIATGAINFITMWNHAGANPLLFQEQVLNLKDPLATFSFYAFMVANGYYASFKNDRLSPSLSSEAKALAIRRISYQAMAAGSFASTLAADIGNSIKSCASSLLPDPKQTVANSAQIAKQIEQSNKLCSQANEIWTMNNMSQKYIPQIFSLLMVQGATDILQAGVNGVTKVGVKSLYENILKLGQKTGFKMLFLNVVLTANPSRFAIRSFAIVGKITQFTFFVGVDHVLNNTLTRGFNNIFKPVLFKTFDHQYLNQFFEVGGKYQWESNKISQLRPLFDPTSRPDKRTAEGVHSFENFQSKFPAEIRNFSKQLQGWRDHLNSDVEVELNSWLAMTNRIINQMQLGETFYKTYLEHLFRTSVISYRSQLAANDPKKLPVEAFKNISSYPYRILPLFGVRYIPWKDSNVIEENAYLNYPLETQAMQSKYLIETAKQFDASRIRSYLMSKESMQLADETVNSLSSGDPLAQGIALEKFALEYRKSLTNNNVEFRRFGTDLTDLIGQPNPKLFEGEGFNAAFLLENKSQAETANFDMVDRDLRINLADSGEYLLHAMICGPKEGFIKEHTSFQGKVTNWEPDFLPPALVKENAKEFCAANGGGVISENFFKSSLTNVKTDKSHKNVTDYIVQNIDTAALGDYRDKEKLADFSAWWSDRAMKSIPAVLEKWDQKYVQIVDKAMGNIFNHKSGVTDTVDRWTQFNWYGENLMGSSIEDSFRFEMEFYLQTTHLVRSKTKFNLPAKAETSILMEAKKIASGRPSTILSKLSGEEYKAVSNAMESLIAELKKPVKYLKHEDQIKSDEELQKIQDEKRKHLSLAEDRQLNYKKYVQLQSNFETAVSELEAAVGLKVKSALATDLFSDLPGEQNASSPNRTTYEVAKIISPNLEQAVVSAAAEGLRNIEENITKYVRMKVLMRRGLKFTKEELLKFNKDKAMEACSKSTRGC